MPRPHCQNVKCICTAAASLPGGVQPKALDRWMATPALRAPWLPKPGRRQGASVSGEIPAWPLSSRDSVLRLTPKPTTALVAVNAGGSMERSAGLLVPRVAH